LRTNVCSDFNFLLSIVVVQITELHNKRRNAHEKN